MENKLSTEVSYYIRERVSKRVSLKEFLDLSSLSVPMTMEEIKSRVIINYGNMFGNYLMIYGVMLCLFLVLHYILIVPIGISLGLVYLCTKSNSEEVVIMGNSIKKDHLYIVSIVLPILFFIFTPSSLVSLFFTFTLSTILCLGHMCVTKPVSKETDI
ncbi:PRA1 family protein 1 [Nematocida sp. AWRm80]|nr:PRA1 family protein 1 [Nematocida sp. AWRm80]